MDSRPAATGPPRAEAAAPVAQARRAAEPRPQRPGNPAGLGEGQRGRAQPGVVRHHLCPCVGLPGGGGGVSLNSASGLKGPRGGGGALTAAPGEPDALLGRPRGGLLIGRKLTVAPRGETALGEGGRGKPMPPQPSLGSLRTGLWGGKVPATGVFPPPVESPSCDERVGDRATHPRGRTPACGAAHPTEIAAAGGRRAHAPGLAGRLAGTLDTVHVAGVNVNVHATHFLTHPVRRAHPQTHSHRSLPQAPAVPLPSQREHPDSRHVRATRRPRVRRDSPARRSLVPALVRAHAGCGLDPQSGV